MRRRESLTERDPDELAQVAGELRWWEARCRFDEPLSAAELRRYRVLTSQRTDPGATVDAIVSASIAAPRVVASLTAAAHGRGAW